jgi:hypothetical protein
MTYTALDGTTVDHVAVQAALELLATVTAQNRTYNSHGSLLMGFHLYKGKAAISLHASFHNLAKVHKQRSNVILGGVRSEVADIAGRLVWRRLGQDSVVGLHATRGKWRMVKWRCWSQPHLRHGLLLGDGRLALLICPVAANGTRTEPFTVHGSNGLVSIRAVSEDNEAVATRAASLHIPHDTSLGDGTKGGKGLEQNLVVDLVGQITDENVMMTTSIFLVRGVGLIGPVDADFLQVLSKGDKLMTVCLLVRGPCGH